METKIEPLFSVVIPAYNRSGVVGNAIESVINQECDDFELIVIDDGSTDDTKEAVLKFRDERVRYIYQKNKGGAEARNNGIDKAAGKYIAFLDSDDIFRKSHLANALTVLDKDKYLCVYTQVVVNRGESGTFFLKPNRGIGDAEHMSDYLLRDRGFVQTSTLIVPSWLAKRVRYDSHVKYGQDTDFAIRLYWHNAKFIMLDEPGAVWNDSQSEGRISDRIDPSNRIEWLNKNKRLMTKKSRIADMGWPVAKGYAQEGKLFQAFFLYGKALLYKCYSPKLAIVVFLQIFLSPRLYRMLANIMAKSGVKP